jgi:hypothetical protein
MCRLGGGWTASPARRGTPSGAAPRCDKPSDRPRFAGQLCTWLEAALVLPRQGCVASADHAWALTLYCRPYFSRRQGLPSFVRADEASSHSCRGKTRWSQDSLQYKCPLFARKFRCAPWTLRLRASHVSRAARSHPPALLKSCCQVDTLPLEMHAH